MSVVKIKFNVFKQIKITYYAFILQKKKNTTKIYNHTLSLFNSKNLNKEYNEILENNFDSDCFFDYSLQLKENVFL